MRKQIMGLLCMLMALSAVPVHAEQMIGWLEMVRIFPGDLLLRAKMDTGAKGSSINAGNISIFEKNGQPWVHFELKDKQKSGEIIVSVLEKKVIRFARIKRKGGGISERPVVLFEMCLCGNFKPVEMNLVDRSHFNYQVLIGRNDLQNDFTIDPAKKFTRKPKCRVAVELDRDR